jgi:hypothetical protein
MKAARIISALSVLGLAAAGAFGATPDGKGGGTATSVKGESQAVTNIIYHGGPVLNTKAGVNVYLIWYGNWSGNTATTILPTFVTDENKSAYYKINTTYYGQNNSQFVTGKVHLSGQANDNYSHGTTLTDSAIFQIVQGQISAGSLPLDDNALYFVLTSQDVNESSGFCTVYCGWHTHGSYSGKDVKYSFVGNAARCLSACAAQSNGPNGNGGADAMASVMAHELEETVTDPDLNAWYFSTGAENADECAWTFGTEYTAPNGTKANMNMNGHDYLIQQNWVQSNTNGRCALSKR